MTHLDDDDLLDAALGVPTSAAAAEHLAACADCADRVITTERTVQALRTVDQVSLETPPERVWRDIAAAMGSGSRVSGRTPVHQSTPAATPAAATRAAGLGAAPAAAADTTAERTRVTFPRGGGAGRLSRALLAAACLVVGAGGGVGATLWLNRPSPAEPRVQVQPQVVRSARLKTLDTQVRRGDAEIVRTAAGIDLQLATNPLDPGSGYLEVWLINTDLRRMVSVGVLPPGARAASFPVPARLLDEGYLIVDISREALDAQPQHSGDSLLRGELSG